MLTCIIINVLSIEREAGLDSNAKVQENSTIYIPRKISFVRTILLDSTFVNFNNTEKISIVLA